MSKINSEDQNDPDDLLFLLSQNEEGEKSENEEEILSSLSKEEEELARKLSELREKKRKIEEEKKKREEEKRRLEELKKPLILIVNGIQYPLISFKVKDREDVRQILIKNGAHWGYSIDEWNIHIDKWIEFRKEVESLPNVKVEFAKRDYEAEIEWSLTAPNWEVSLTNDKKEFFVKAGPREYISSNLFNWIPGSNWDWKDKKAFIPLAEGWRIPKVLEGKSGVEYEEEALERIQEEIERRKKLDEIAQKKETDFIQRMHPELYDRLLRAGYRKEELDGFQGVGAEFLYESGLRTLLADQTGLGKTTQTIVAIEIWRKHKNPNFRTLSVLKSGLIPNWRREILRATGEEALIIRTGKPEQNADVITGLFADKKPWILVSYDTLASYQDLEISEENTEKIHFTTLREDPKTHQEVEKWHFFPWINMLNLALPDCLVGDEIHMAKNDDTLRFKALRRLTKIPHVLLTTASPILNRTNEWWTMLHMLNPVNFPSKINFEDRYTYDGRRARNVDLLHELVRPMFIRRKKKDVQKDLPPIHRIQHIFPLSETAQERYKEAEEGLYESLATFNVTGQEGDFKEIQHVLEKILRLKQICAHEATEHTADYATSVVDEANGEREGKVLIFSQFKGSAYRIHQLLGEESVCTVRKPTNLKGNGEDDFISLSPIERDQLFESARHDKNVKYIVTTMAAKEGHNLEFCDWVITNDLAWTPADHFEQAEGRAYGRLSNPHKIDSIYMIAEAEIIQWIWDLLAQKIEIIDEAIEGVEASRDIGKSILTDLIRKIKDNQYKRKGR